MKLSDFAVIYFLCWFVYVIVCIRDGFVLFVNATANDQLTLICSVSLFLYYHAIGLRAARRPEIYCPARPWKKVASPQAPGSGTSS